MAGIVLTRSGTKGMFGHTENIESDTERQQHKKKHYRIGSLWLADVIRVSLLNLTGSNSILKKGVQLSNPSEILTSNLKLKIDRSVTEI